MDKSINIIAQRFEFEIEPTTVFFWGEDCSKQFCNGDIAREDNIYFFTGTLIEGNLDPLIHLFRSP